MEKIQNFQTDPSLKLMDRVQQALLYYQYSYRTKQSYCRWIKEYIKFLGLRKVPQDRFQKEIGSFLEFLIKERKLSSASQKQALNAIVFLYKRVFDVAIDVKIEPAKTRRKITLPKVLTKQEVKRVLSGLKGKHLLMAQLLYGSGLRLMECIRLKVDDLDFKQERICVTPVKGDNKRTVMMPKMVWQGLFDQVETVKNIPCHYVFPSKKMITDPVTGMAHRPHVPESGLQKAVKTAAKRAGIEKPVSCNTFRHSFAVHLLENNVNIHVVKDLMGHVDIKATEVYTHVMEKKEAPVLSPLDLL